MEDLKASLNSVFNERIKNPLWGTLLLAYSAYNWKFLFYLFTSEIEPQKRITNAFQIYITNSSYWMPIIITGVLILLFPLLSTLAIEISEWHKTRQNAILKQANSTRYITLEESKILRQKINDLEDKAERDILSVRTEAETTINELEKKHKHISERAGKLRSIIDLGSDPIDKQTIKKIINEISFLSSTK